LVESMELRLDEGLELAQGMECWMDETAIIRMDAEARYKSYNDAIGGGWMAPNEARRKEDLPPVDGGDTPYLQVQNYSLAALAKRDAEDPFAKPEPAPVVNAEPESETED